MAFENAVGADNKQRINLSDYAYDVICSDMLAFNNNKFSNFINRIIDNFKDTSDASISIALKREEKKLEKILDSDSDMNDERTMKKLLEAKKNELTKKINGFESGESYRIRLNNKNLEYLTEPGFGCEEDEYYYTEVRQSGKIKSERHPKIGKYLKALLEDYAIRPFCERERIYYKDVIDLICRINSGAEEEEKKNNQKKNQRKKAIDLSNTINPGNDKPGEKKLLFVKFHHQKGIRCIFPYEISKDSFQMYNYVLGFLYDDNTSSKELKAWRLSTICEAIKTSKTINVNETDIETLEKAKTDRGVQFMPGKKQEIVVCLTDAGKRKFMKQLHLRPKCVEVRNGCDYVFNCTPKQAEIYFTRLGKDAYIKEPESLRKEMLKYYRDAYNRYKD